MSVKKICVLCRKECGVPLGAVIAVKCPEIRVTVVQTNPEVVFQLNTNQIPPSMYVPGLEDFIRKCQNKNLFFTANDKAAIKEADIVFVLSESKAKTYGEGEKHAIDLSDIEEAAFLIAESADSDKIVVENSSVPLKTAECVKKALKYHSKPGVTFQVLSNPEFYEHGSALRNLLFPDCILIGNDNTPKGVAAARLLASIYERWVAPENIFMNTNWTVELSKIATSVMRGQQLASTLAIFAMCDESKADVTPFLKLIPNEHAYESGYNVGKYPTVIRSLLYLCEWYNLPEAVEYWRQVLDLFEFSKNRIFKNFLASLNQNAWGKRIAILGFACYKDTERSVGSSAVDLCKSFLEENALVSVYDPRVTKKCIVEGVAAAGCKAPPEVLDKQITVYDDPYRATRNAHVIVLCCTWPEMALLDFARIFCEMEKPAYVFDLGQILPHSELLKIGFQVYCLGKYIKNSL